MKFPVIDNTILFAMNPDTDCHHRYGLIGSSICPIGRDTMDGIYQAASWIAAEEREGKTWRSVPEARGDKSDLLIAYIEQSADGNIELARIFSGGDDSEREAVFEGAAGSLVAALDAKGAIASDWTCRVLVLHRISKGQVQLQISRRYLVSDTGGFAGVARGSREHARNFDNATGAHTGRRGCAVRSAEFVSG